MVKIDSRSWMRTPGRVDVLDQIALRFEETRTKHPFKTAAEAAVVRDGKVAAVITTSDVGTLWLPGPLHRGMELDASLEWFVSNETDPDRCDQVG